MPMRSTVPVNVTIAGKWPADNAGARSQGEVAGVGSLYSAVLVERPNISNSRNQGPVGAYSRVGISMTTIPIATMASRMTGRIA